MAVRHTLPPVPSQAPRLITLPISHYCEKARWALERARIPYAALAASVLVPSRYGVPLPPLEALPEPFAGEVRALCEHPAGAFALRLYDQERPYTQGR